MLNSRKSRILLVAALLACAVIAGAAIYHFTRAPKQLAPAPATAPPALLSDVPADAPILLYIDAAALRRLQIPLASLLGVGGPAPRADRDYARFLRGTGFDYTRDLDQAAIAFWPRDVASSANATSALSANRALAVADGRFDQRKIAAYALETGKLIPHPGRSVYYVPGAPPAAFEFLSAARIAIASGPAPTDVLSLAAVHPNPAALTSRVARISAAPVFAVARLDNLPPGFYNSLSASPQLARLAHGLHNVSFTIQPAPGRLDATLEAECDSIKDAFELASVADFSRLFASTAIADARRRGQLSPAEARLIDALVHQVQITRDDRFVRLTLSIPTELPSAPAAPARR